MESGGLDGLRKSRGSIPKGQLAELLDNLRNALDEALEMNREQARAAVAEGQFEEVELVP